MLGYMIEHANSVCGGQNEFSWAGGGGTIIEIVEANDKSRQTTNLEKSWYW